MATMAGVRLCVVLAVAAACTLAMSPEKDMTLLELANYFGAHEFVRLATKAGLNGTLSDKENLTLFAFSDKAYDNFPEAHKERLEGDITLLKTVLWGHVATKTVTWDELRNEMKLPSLDFNRDIRINVYDNSTYTASGAQGIFGDWMGTNGAYYTVNRIIFPPSPGTALDLITQASNFNNLLLAVSKANLPAVVEGDPMTFFAPTDDAFAKLPAGELDKLFLNRPLLRSVLEYHMVNSTLYSAGLMLRSDVTTMEGHPLPVYMTKGMVGNAKIVTADLSTSNGVVHAIDTVLMPPRHLFPHPHRPHGG